MQNNCLIVNFSILVLAFQYKICLMKLIKTVLLIQNIHNILKLIKILKMILVQLMLKYYTVKLRLHPSNIAIAILTYLLQRIKPTDSINVCILFTSVHCTPVFIAYFYLHLEFAMQTGFIVFFTKRIFFCKIKTCQLISS